MQIGKAISELRLRHNLSQEALAERLFVSRFLVSRWETGARRPDYPTIERIAEIFGVPPSHIVDRDDLVLEELRGCLPEDSCLTVGELTPLLNSFLRQLKKDEAELFLHRYYFLESTAEIAALYHKKENHVRSTLSRIRKKLRRYVKEVTV